MTTGEKDDVTRAAELYAQAREAAAAERYREARRLFEESLALHEDDEVRAAYLELLSAIGPA